MDGRQAETVIVLIYNDYLSLYSKPAVWVSSPSNSNKFPDFSLEM